MKNIDTKNLNVFDQVIYNRGVSSEYFGIDIEDISSFSDKQKNLYELGKIHGQEKRKSLKNDEKTLKNYIEQRRSYLRILGSWAATGIIDVDTNTLEEIELRFFNEGYDLNVISGKTTDDILEEKRKLHKKHENKNVLVRQRSIEE